jgi:hypothetical protein
MPPQKKTIAVLLTQVTELRQRAAVQTALVQILRTRYLPRDGVPEALAQIDCEGAPVSADIIEEMVEELEDVVSEINKEVRSILSQEA